MSFIFSVFCFFISYVINIFYLFNGIVPLFFIPYVLYKVIKRVYKPKALLMCIVAPISWYVILFVLGYIIGMTGNAKYFYFFFNNSGAFWGFIIAAITVIINILGKAARDEFIERLEPFRIYEE